VVKPRGKLSLVASLNRPGGNVTGISWHKVSKKYLPLYVAEFQFRYNNREDADILERQSPGARMKIILYISICILIFLGFVVWLGSSSLHEEPVAQSNQTDRTTDTPKKEYPSIHAALIRGFERLGTFIHHFHEEIIAVGTLFIAVFTIILAFATGFLYVATRDLVKGAEDTARRQLRAYVVIDGDKFEGKPGKFVSNLKIINTGQTPAYKLRIKSKTDILPCRLPKDFDFAIKDPGNASTITLGHNQHVGHSSYLTAQEVTHEAFVAALADNAENVIYTYGVVTYVDAFDHCWHTNFCFYFVWEKDSVHSHASEHHNDAS
jgi:hypothetical protein